MAGWIVQHPVSQGETGMGLRKIDFRFTGHTAYLVPGRRIVRELQKKVREYRLNEDKVAVQTFDQFVRQMLPQESRLMKPVEQRLILQHAVSQAREKAGLSYFYRIMDQPSGLEQVEARIGELKRSGIRPRRLGELWRDRDKKYQELALIYQAYEGLLDRHGLWDHEEPYWKLMQHIRQGTVKLPDQVVAEHFSDLSFIQEQLLIQMVTAGVPVTLHLIWDEERPRLFQQTIRSVNQLKQRGFRLKKATENQRKREKAYSLLHLEKQAFRKEPVKGEVAGAVEVLSAPGVKREVEQVVLRIRKWLQERQASLSDVAIIARDLPVYRSHLLAALNKAGLPCTEANSRMLREHPLFQTVLAGLAVKRGQEEYRSFLLESPYPFQQAGNYLQVYKSLGSPRNKKQLSQRVAERFPQGDEEPVSQKIKELKHFYQWLETEPTSHSWRDWISWFESWITELNPSRNWPEMAKDPELLPLVAEEVKAWEGIKRIIGEWKEIFQETDLGESFCDLSSFSSALEQAATHIWVEREPGQRGGIRILEPNQVWGDRYPAVFLLGCSEGKWPRPVSEDWLISDDERLRLKKEGVGLALSQEQRGGQLYPFFRSVQAATELLVFSYPSSNEEGKKTLPSPFLEETLRPFLKEQVLRRVMEVGDFLPGSWNSAPFLSRNLEQAIAVLGDQRKQQNQNEIHKAFHVIRHSLEKQPEEIRVMGERIQVERMRWGRDYTSFDGLLPISSLTKQMEKMLQQHVWSATQLNDLVRCRFHYFAGWILGAKEPTQVEEGLSPQDRGDLMHRILCRFWDRYREQGLDTAQGEAAREHLIAVAKSVFREFAQEKGGTASIQLHIEQKRLIYHMLSMLDHELDWQEQVGQDAKRFYPWLLEWSFGLGKDPALVQRREIDPETREYAVSLRLTPNRRIRLRGKVDRVDQDDEGHYILYDYKSGRAPETTELMEGAHLQLPLYLWALQTEFGLAPEKAVGTAFFTPGVRKGGKAPKDNRNKGLWRQEMAYQAGIGRVKGLLKEEEWQQVFSRIRQKIDGKLKQVEQGDFAVEPTWECPDYCPHRRICRIDSRRMAGKEKPEGKERGQ